MKKVTAITLTAFVLLLASAITVSAVDTLEIRGPVADVKSGETYKWGPQDFAGFYYDIDDNLGTETLTMTITGDAGNEILEKDGGVVYRTDAQKDDFDFDEWGKYYTIGFLAEEYFAGYVTGGYLFDDSGDETLLEDEQLSKVLYDDDDERTFTTGTPLKLKEDYELAIQSIDLDGNKVYVQLMKEGAVVDSAVVEPSKDLATLEDKTYTYTADLGDTSDIVVVAVHFKNAFRGADQDLATVDGIWQISDATTDVAEDTEYDKMTIEDVSSEEDNMYIEMENTDNKITLSANKDQLLMENIRILTADMSADAENPLRFYIYEEATIAAEEEAAPAPEAVKAPEAAPAAVEEAAPAAEENVSAEGKVEEKLTEEEQKAEEKTGIPGFEAVFAITGLLAVSYLVLRKRE